jgi:cyanophycinase
MRYLHFWAAAGLVLCGNCFSSHAQTVDNILGFPRQAVANRGTLVMCGGGGGTPDEVFDEFVRLAGGKDARIVFIPSAAEFADVEHARSHFAEWEEYGCVSLIYIDAKSRAEADTEKFVEPLKKATAVWIAGGDQERLVNLYSDTKLAEAVRDLLARGGVVGGISAGAAVMSQVMIRDGSNHEAVVGKGFGLIDGAIVDQHFSQRGRYARLLGLLEDRPQLLGLGIDEDTSLIVQGNHLRVMGNARATVILFGGDDGARLVYRLKGGQEADLVVTRSVKSGRRNIRLRIQEPAAAVAEKTAE